MRIEGKASNMDMGQTTGTISEHPLLAIFSSPLRNFGTAGMALGEILAAMASALAPTGITGIFQFSLSQDGEIDVWSITVGPDGALVDNTAVQEYDLHVITSLDTWCEVAAGRLTPFDAFVSGRLRFQGDPLLGSRAVQQLQKER